MSLGLGLSLTSRTVGKQGGASPLPVFAVAASRRIDIVGIGDSNQLLNGFGWDHGIQYALSQSFKMWATGLITQNENSGSGSGAGYTYGRFGALMGAVSGADANLDKYLNKGAGGLFPGFYTYVADGNTIASTFGNGLLLNAGGAIDAAAALEFDCYTGTFPTGAGIFRPSVIKAPSTFVNALASISTNTGVFGLVKTTIPIIADATRAGFQLNYKYTSPSVTGITGPFFTTYMRARQINRLTGFSYSTREYRGGQSARTMAYDLQQATDDTLTHYFGILRADQLSAGETKPYIVVMVNSGLNDRNETLASVGPAAALPGDSSAAFVDNFTAIVHRVQAIWTLNGWDWTEINWVFTVSHPQSDPDDAELAAYRVAIAAYGATLPRTTVVDFAAKISSARMLANNWYLLPGPDKNHLMQAGYEGMGLLNVTV